MASIRNTDVTLFSRAFESLRHAKTATERQHYCGELTALFLQPMGLVKLYAYFYQLTNDVDECAKALARLLCSKPQRFGSIQEYALAIAGNMQSLADVLLSDGSIESRQALSSILKSYYYWLRRHDCEESMAFLFTGAAGGDRVRLDTEAAQVEARLLEFICESQTLNEDLEPVYAKILCELVSAVLGSSERPAALVTRNVAILARLLGVEAVCRVVSGVGIRSEAQAKRLADAGDGRWRQLLFLGMIQGHSHADLCLAVLGRLVSIDEDIGRFLNLMARNDSFASEMLKKATERFSSLLEATGRSDLISDVIADLTAENPAIIAHGLHALRKHADALSSWSGEEVLQVGQILSRLLIHTDTFVYMNVVKTLSELGRPAVAWGPLILDQVSSEAGAQCFPRFAELAALWLAEHPAEALSDDFVLKIALLCCDLLQDAAEENRLSCLDLLSALVSHRWSIVATRQTLLLGSLVTSRGEESELEKQVRLSLISSFIASSQQNGTSLDGALITSCWEYLHTFASADSIELRLMAYNCIMEIERLRNK